jgi:3-isopropylmalate dehydrogenase
MMASQSVACLAGDGVGPELMAEATRALVAVCRMHSVAIDDVHLPFGGEAVTRYGHPLPPATRRGYRGVEAILVSSPHEPALEGVKADVDPTCRVARVHVRRGADVLVIGPVGPCAEVTAVARAFDAAATRRARVTSVGTSPELRAAVDAERERRAGIAVERSTLGEVLVALADEPHTLDVVVADGPLAGGIADAAAHLSHTTAVMAYGWVSDDGPGVFVPATCEPDDVAGFGVANPAGMLLTAALLLGEGLGRRSAARTLERAVGEVVRMNGSAPHGTRAFTDEVIARLPEARTDVDHFEEVWAA